MQSHTVQQPCNYKKDISHQWSNFFLQNSPLQLIRSTWAIETMMTVGGKKRHFLNGVSFRVILGASSHQWHCTWRRISFHSVIGIPVTKDLQHLHKLCINKQCHIWYFLTTENNTVKRIVLRISFIVNRKWEDEWFGMNDNTKSHLFFLSLVT